MLAINAGARMRPSAGEKDGDNWITISPTHTHIYIYIIYIYIYQPPQRKKKHGILTYYINPNHKLYHHSVVSYGPARDVATFFMAFSHNAPSI
jgi:hypothetical protein